LNETSYLVQDLKLNIKSLKSQLELKNDDINNFKKEFEKVLMSKEKKIEGYKMKIGELQGVMGQTYLSSYNAGMNNIAMSNKINEEINSMMKKMKIDDNEDKLKDKKYSNR